jgi:hypothetical protein
MFEKLMAFLAIVEKESLFPKPAAADIVKLDKEKFRLGHTLVWHMWQDLFPVWAGIGGWMEEQHENKIGSVLAWLKDRSCDMKLQRIINIIYY